jgi:ferritin-like metal-binding protein YciE
MARINGNSSDLLIAWLRDAYAMEKSLVPVLENHAKDAAGHPEVRVRLEQHAMETRNHVNLVEQCLRLLGEEPSTLKNTVAKMMGAVQSVASSAFHDDVVKNALTDFGTENFEIACYRALSEAAKALQQNEIVNICERILNEERQMARFLEQHLPTTVHETLGVAV